MIKSVKRSLIICISLAIFILGILLLYADVPWLIPVFAIISSFFMLIIHGLLFLSGNNDNNVFDTYQKTVKTRSKALEDGLNNKKEK